MHLLNDQHRDMLERQSSIAASLIEQRGYRTVTVKADLHRLGFYATGLRQGEILALQWPQVDLFRRTITAEDGS